AAQMVIENTPRTVATSSLIGTTILHYRVLDRIGAGGEGIVYKAEDARLSRFVALKVLRDAARDPESFERFQRESRAASALNQPGKHFYHGRRAGKGARLRPRETGACRGSSRHANRANPGNRAVHESSAGLRRKARSPHRHFFVGLRDSRNGCRSSGIHRREPH